MTLPVKEERMITLHRALKQFDLECAWEYVKEAHTDGLGYHNLDHIEIAMMTAQYLACAEGGNIRLAIITAMVHDLQHTGKGPDADNVERAIFCLHDLISCEDPKFLSKMEQNIVEQAVRCTMFAEGKFPIAPRTLQDRIMRDADLWNIHLEPKNACHMILGLGKELGAWNESTLAQGIENTVAFYKTVTWHTHTGLMLAERVDSRAEELRRRYGNCKQ